MKYYTTLFFSIFLMLSVFSCKDEYTICGQSKIVAFKVGFYANGELPSAVPSLTIGLVGGTYIYNKKQNLYNAAFSINPAVDSAAYFIKLADYLPADTLTVVYTTQSLFISADCGSVYTNAISRAYCTKNTIVSVKITDAAINLTGNENIKIYY